ncbi:MAG: radical SAM protein [Bacillota bacterium]
MIFKKIDGSLPTLSSNSPLCSSGLNYIVVKANGDINRCFKDPSILGDMLEVNNIIYQEVKECGVKYACDASSDQMFCTQWNVKNKKNDFFYKNPVSINWKESEDPNTVNKKHIFAVIYPTERCNFKCPYCCNYYPDDNSNERPVVSERPLQDWFKFLELLYSKYQSNVQININGGEPFIRNDIVDIISRCLDYNFECSIVTNFSVFNQLEKLLNLNHKNKNKLSLSITLHPVNKNYDFSKSLKYILLFKESGYKLRITLLGWPENKKYH